MYATLSQFVIDGDGALQDNPHLLLGVLKALAEASTLPVPDEEEGIVPDALLEEVAAQRGNPEHPLANTFLQTANLLVGDDLLPRLQDLNLA